MVPMQGSDARRPDELVVEIVSFAPSAGSAESTFVVIGFRLHVGGECLPGSAKLATSQTGYPQKLDDDDILVVRSSEFAMAHVLADPYRQALKAALWNRACEMVVGVEPTGPKRGSSDRCHLSFALHGEVYEQSAEGWVNGPYAGQRRG